MPTTFPLSALEKFTFGGPDGKDDPLLEQCSLRFRPIIEFLDENKSIVVGERGTGKTALFRLIAEEKLHFINRDKRTQVCIPIDEELAYRTLQEHVSKQIQDHTGKSSIGYRIVWELLFVSRCLDKLEKKYGGDTELKALKSKFFRVVGWQSDESVGFLDILTRTKKTFGVTLEAGHTGYVVPNFYASIEPSKNPEEENANNLLTLDIVDIKATLNAFLKKKKAFVYVLLDKLDEFVAGEEISQRTTISRLNT
ncbi:MAG: P-loop ATPase, Sll1717 family [Gammaproteobacteria bacterium]